MPRLRPGPLHRRRRFLVQGGLQTRLVSGRGHGLSVVREEKAVAGGFWEGREGGGRGRGMWMNGPWVGIVYHISIR